ncbi:MAG TPA: DCC1-like thiol-disulfide oxidoreductase family protein [Parvularculaceae bacterium]|nr:DCC1-like thiol-disulfide oxidoreductase family protein [Parvularculaceae bacterium]HNS85802.1 DCC1-like thiol-disulfide oxidoreductase family protein [Parvularculaceae bacterium]
MRGRKYTYRADPNVPAFDDSAPLYIFDGYCVLCSEGVKWMVRRDPKGSSKFIAVQSSPARAIYAHYGIDPDKFDTFMLLKNGCPYYRYRGWLETAKLMPAPWKWLGYAGHIVPEFIGDLFYHIIQRNRFDWFGRRETCLVPDAATRARFL